MLNGVPASNEDLLTTSNSSVLRATFVCGLQTYLDYLDSKDLMAPCNYKWDRLNFSAALFIFTHSCLVKNWDFGVFFCGSFVFCLCDCHVFKEKTLKCQLYQEETTVTVWGYSKHFLSHKRRMMNLYLLLYIGEFLKSSRNSLPFRQFLLGETAKFGTLLRGVCVFRVSQ